MCTEYTQSAFRIYTICFFCAKGFCLVSAYVFVPYKCQTIHYDFFPFIQYTMSFFPILTRYDQGQTFSCIPAHINVLHGICKSVCGMCLVVCPACFPWSRPVSVVTNNIVLDI